MLAFASMTVRGVTPHPAFSLEREGFSYFLRHPGCPLKMSMTIQNPSSLADFTAESLSVWHGFAGLAGE